MTLVSDSHLVPNATASRRPMAGPSTAALSALTAEGHPLHAVHNSARPLHHVTRPQATVHRLPLVGAPRTQLEALADAFTAGPISLDLLQALLAEGFAATPLAHLLAEPLAYRCALPTELPPPEQAAWREVLLDALRLRAPDWEREAVVHRHQLGEGAAWLHPLFKDLRNALYRPHTMPHAEWRAALAAEPDTDSRDVALAWQRQRQPTGERPTDLQRARSERIAQVEHLLRTAAPAATNDEMKWAMRDVRKAERRERGLLEPRIGLLRLIADGALDPAALFVSPQDASPALRSPSLDGASRALATLLLDCREATLQFEAAVTPLGRYGTVPQALTSLLFLPGQLDGLRTWAANVAFAAEALIRGEPAWVRDATRGYVRQDDWPAQVQAAGCSATSGNGADDALRLHRQVMEGLAGPPPAGTALALPDQFCVETWNVPGLKVAQAERIQAFMQRQLPDGADADALQSAYQHVIGAPASPVVSVPSTGSTTSSDSASLRLFPPPRALAGALTDQGTWSLLPPSTGAWPPGAVAQFPAQVQGYAPLLLLQGLINTIRTASWWRALPGYVERTPQGLLSALEDLFMLAGEPLRDRPPTADAIERFLASTQGRALLQDAQQVPELAEWQRYEIQRGGEDTQVYIFMRMLRQLIGAVHAHTHARHNGTDADADRTALYRLARIGTSAGALLAQYGTHAPDAGRSYFQRTLEKSRPGAAHSPTPFNDTLREQHGKRVRLSHDICPPGDYGPTPDWLRGAAHALLTEQSYEALSEADRCLLQVVALLTGFLSSVPEGDWRSVAPSLQDWRNLADHLHNTDYQTPTWETGVGVHFHRVASYLRAWEALAPDPDPPHDLRDLRVFVRRLVEPLQQLYSAVDLPLDEADEQYPAGFDAFQRFYSATGTALTPADMAPETRSERSAHLTLRAWLQQYSGTILAHALCPLGATSLRDGLVALVDHALATSPLHGDRALPPVWRLIMEGPHALQQWLDSPAGREAGMGWFGRLPGGVSTSPEWHTLAAMLREAVLAQLPASAGALVPAPDAVQARFENGNAPVLSLAVQLARQDPSLLRDPGQALRLAVALLVTADPGNGARLPLTFPLWPHAGLLPHDVQDAGDDDPLLPWNWLAGSVPTPPVPMLDVHALPGLDTLLARMGLNLLHTQDPTQAPRPADVWEVISRTEGFAELGRQLLQQSGWTGPDSSPQRSPQDAQLLVAQALLLRYVSHPRIERLRAHFNAPTVVNQTFSSLLRQVRETITTQQPHASRAAVDLLQWLLLRELDQPALLVAGIPDGLTYGRSLESVAFLHGVQLLESLQPGASARATFAQVSSLPVQLAQPPEHAGENDALHTTWARTLLRPALLYAIAHGQLPGVSHVDAATPEQAQAALGFLQEAQERQALYVGQIATRPPERRELASRTLTAAGVDPSYWQKSLIDLPEGLLEQHGIVPGDTVEGQRSALGLSVPGDIVGTDKVETALTTADDTLLDLVAADAYQWQLGPTTQTLFDNAFAVYREKVETGLAGLIEELLRTLPDEDLALLRAGTCTAVRVSTDIHKAHQGLLLRCQPPGKGPAVHFEVVPSAGIARRARHEADGSEYIDLQSMIDGTTSVIQTDRLMPLSSVTQDASDTVVDMHGTDALRDLARAAAKQMWDPWLDDVRQHELDHKTRLEKVWDAERHLATRVAEFVVPFFKCGEDLLAGDHSAGALAGCAMDVLTSVLPAGRFIGSTVRIVGAAGERTVLSMAADTGRALATFGREIASQSGLFLLRDMGRGAVWLGSRAWTGALRSAGWLRRVLREGAAFGAAGHGLENALAHEAVAPHLLESLQSTQGTVAAGRIGGQPPALVVNVGGRWYRFDPIARAAYGPPLEDLALVHPLPPALPTQRVDNGVTVHLGDATDAQFVEVAPDHWEVWIEGTPYRLDPESGSLLQRDVHAHEPGELEVVDQHGCRVRRGVEASPGQAACSGSLQLQFVPDRQVPLPESPSPDDLLRRAFGYRRYTPEAVVPGNVPLHQELEEESLDGVSHLLGETPEPDPDTVDPSGRSSPLMIHNGKVCQWHAPLSRQNRLMPPRLSPLTPSEAHALRVPDSPDYLPIIGGRQVKGSTLGLPENVDTVTRDAVDAQAPVIEVGALVAGVGGSRQLRGLHMGINGQASIVIEPDTGVFYVATLAPDSDTLHFIRLRDNQIINQYLRQSEALRVPSEYAQESTLRHNIAEMTFKYMQRTFSAEQHAQYPTYEAYLAHVRQRGHTDVLDRYARKVLSGQQQQSRFIRLARELIPDWKMLGACPLAEREAVADTLNALFPLQGMEEGWEPLTAEGLGTPEVAQKVLKHANGANLAYLEVKLRNGQTRIYYSLSGGQRASKLRIVNPPPTESRVYINSGEAGLPVDSRLLSLPVLRHAGSTRTIVFDRTLDSENRLMGQVMNELDPHEIEWMKLTSTLGPCTSCGGIVLSQGAFWLQQANPQATLTVRYLIDYVK